MPRPQFLRLCLLRFCTGTETTDNRNFYADNIIHAHFSRQGPRKLSLSIPPDSFRSDDTTYRPKDPGEHVESPPPTVEREPLVVPTLGVTLVSPTEKTPHAPTPSQIRYQGFGDNPGELIIDESRDGPGARPPWELGVPDSKTKVNAESEVKESEVKGQPAATDTR